MYILLVTKILHATFKNNLVEKELEVDFSF